MKNISTEKLIAEIERRIEETKSMKPTFDQFWAGQISAFKGVLKIVNSLQQEQTEVSAGHGWVARDMNNDIHYFSVEPARLRVKWWDRDYSSMDVDRSLFDWLSWEDEPIEVELFIHKFGENERKKV